MTTTVADSIAICVSWEFHGDDDDDDVSDFGIV
jgi:hypothetical protein